VPGHTGVQLRIAERAARSVRADPGTAVAAGGAVRRRRRSAWRARAADRRSRRGGRAVRPAAGEPAGSGAARLPAGDARPARHRGGCAELSGTAAADGHVGPDGARAVRGPVVRGGHRAGPQVLRHGGHGRRPRGAAAGARRARLALDGVSYGFLRRGAVRTGAPGSGEPAGARFRRAGLERGPVPARHHAANRRRAAGRLRGPGLRRRSRRRPGRGGPPVPRRAGPARHPGRAEHRRPSFPASRPRCTRPRSGAPPRWTR
jgi:hypothetical protein